MKRIALAWLASIGCVTQPTEPAEEAETELASTVCGKGPTVKGIDVSYWQGTIDWAAVRGDGVEYAFVRVSDSLDVIDDKFPANWAGAKANGILRGAYQYFRPDQDAIAQAELFLDKLGTLEPDDLPPVIDVETNGGLAPAQVEAKVRQWIDRVRTATGREPIIYTGYYFLRDRVAADITTSPLWHAQYTSAECPFIPPPWQDWAFWQYSAMGTVAGIAGNVDMNRFNGTYEELLALTAYVPPPPPDEPPPDEPLPDEPAPDPAPDGGGCDAGGGAGLALAFLLVGLRRRRR